MNLPDFFGLDIGNHSIKICQIRWRGKKPGLDAIGSSSTPRGVMGSESEDHQKELAKHIKEAKSEAKVGTNKVVVGLPEAKIFTQLITVPKVEDKKLEELIHWEAKKYVPIPIDEVRVDWIFLGERLINNQPHIDIFLIAAPNNLIDRYLKILEFAGLEPVGVETESIATTRALWWPVQIGLGGNIQVDSPSIMILDFGSQSTDLSVVQKGSLLFSQSLVTGSDALTEAIASNFGLEIQQAEEYKRSYGLDESQLEGKIANSLKPVMQVIVQEAKKTLDFFRSRFEKSTPRRLLLVGDGAKLPGILTYMANELGIEAALADPFGNIEISRSIKSKIEQLSSVGYCSALGLALKTE
ncbi:MAG: type IV pilus assembly protein PilM [Candidatus Dojkabacteria bacterium]|nr:type IV pilus assembly protein PilM [Candidatus Dojkabacteria bacterium]